jgi:filamentous hemagglutinin family protein
MIHNRSKWSGQRPSMVSRPRLVVVHGFLLSLLMIANPVYAQVTTSITPTTGVGDLTTAVTQTGNVYNITGGTRPENGTNLFHSFGNFSVGALDTARFLNTTPDLATSNILGRVTGGNPSSLFGTIDTLSYGAANLFLMNPDGIVFGPNATLNVGGSVVFTTANSVRLFDETNSATFYANPASDAVTTPGRMSILSAAPLVDFGFVTPAAFGFLDPTPAAITVQGSTLSVDPGQSITFVGGEFTMTGGNLSAPNGQVGIVSVASAGEILHQNLRPAPNINGDSFSAMGTINLSQGAVADVSADAAGTIKIRGGQFVIADATLSANTKNLNGASTAIDINLTGDLTISDTRATSAITARTNGAGNAGKVQIKSANMQATSTDSGFVTFTLIDGHTAGDGSAANVNIMTGDLTVTGPAGTFHFIGSGPQAAGPGGNITIEAQHNIELTGMTISTGTQLAEILGVEASGPAGNLTLTADRLVTDHAFLLTTATFGAETQQAGNVTINVRDISMANSVASAAGFFGGGAITINADTLITQATQFDTFTVLGPAEGITFNGRILELSNGSTWSTSTFGDHAAGDINVVAIDYVSLLGNGGTDPSGFFSNSFGEFGSLGGSGNITVTTQKLAMSEGRINASTATSGLGGDVSINASTVEISGEFPFPDDGSGWFGITDIHPSGIFTQTVGSEFCAESCGNAGNILANIGKLTMGPGAQLNSGTSNTGRGGDITVNATDSISMSGTLGNGSPVGISSRSIGVDPDAGSGGNIALTAGQSVTISNGASVSASSTGPGDAGNILINAGQQFEMRNSSVTTKSEQAGGGNIEINATNQIRLVDSEVNASAFLDGGNITIDPILMILQNSQILAQAVQGAGGNITITTPLFLADQSSLVSASSQFGLNGTVTIQSPTSNLSGSLGPLASKTNQAQSLVTQRCAALVNGQASSFVVAGREQLPADPGGWLSGPIALAGIDVERFGEGTVAEGTSNLEPRTSNLLASDRVSLRRLTPARFLMANFADSEATGCHS